MSSEYVYVADASELNGMLSGLPTGEALSIDTEFVRRDSYYPKVGLIQLSCVNSCLLIDPLEINDWSVLVALLTDTRRVKIMHSCSEDLEVFLRLLDVVPKPVFDTQIAAAYCGYDHGLGYQRLVKEITGVDLPKSQTQSDWLRRPLDREQLGYAADDVIYLRQIYLHLAEILEEAGRLAWLEEDCSTLLVKAEAGYQVNLNRVKGAGQLNRRQRAIVRELIELRESIARDQDRPRGWILSDQQCVAIARQENAEIGFLRELKSLGRGAPQRYGAKIQEAVASAMALPDDQLPSEAPTRPERRVSELIKSLQRESRSLANKWNVAPEQLLRRTDCELLARRFFGEASLLPEHLQGWRRHHVVDPLLSEHQQKGQV